MTDWEAEGRAEALKAKKGLEAAARKVRKLLVKTRAGDSNWEEVNRAIRAFERKAGTPEVRVHHNAEAFSTERELKKEWAESRDAGVVARTAANDEELRKLKESKPDIDPFLNELRIAEIWKGHPTYGKIRR